MHFFYTFYNKFLTQFFQLDSPFVIPFACTSFIRRCSTPTWPVRFSHYWPFCTSGFFYFIFISFFNILVSQISTSSSLQCIFECGLQIGGHTNSTHFFHHSQPEFGFGNGIHRSWPTPIPHILLK
jgi:hypothetical protein